MHSLSFRQNFSWVLVANVIYAGCQWGVVVVFTKLGSAVMLGQYALGLALTAPIIAFANLQLRAVFITDVEGKVRFCDYLGLRIICSTLALLLIAGIAVGLGYRLETALIIVFVGISKAFETLSDILYGLLQRRERMDLMAKSLITKGLMSLGALGLGVYLTGSALWGTMALAVVMGLRLLFYDVRNASLMLPDEPRIRTKWMADLLGGGQAFVPRFDVPTMRRLFLKALPIGVAMFLVSLNSSIPRYFVEHCCGEAALGIFAALAYIQIAAGTVVSALGEAATPRLAKYYVGQARSGYLKLLGKLLGVVALLGLAGISVAWLGGRQLLTLIYKAEYGERADVFLWLMIAAGITYIGSILGRGATATGAFQRFTIPYLLLTITTGVLSLVLVPRYGLIGAAWAVCGSALASCLTPLFIIVRTMGDRNEPSTKDGVGEL